MGTLADADLILTNGVVYTVDAGRSRHEAVAIRDGRIAAAGGVAAVMALKGPHTEVVDLAGRVVGRRGFQFRRESQPAAGAQRSGRGGHDRLQIAEVDQRIRTDDDIAGLRSRAQVLRQLRLHQLVVKGPLSRQGQHFAG